MEISILPYLLIVFALIGVAVVFYVAYYIHFIRGVKPRQVEGSCLCPRCGRNLIEATPYCPECNKKVIVPDNRP